MIVHLNNWHQGTVRLFVPDYVRNIGFVGAEHQSRCFMLVLKKFESAEMLANRLLQEETRTAIVYKSRTHGARSIPESKMRDAMMYIFRFPTDGMQTDIDSSVIPTVTTKDDLASGIPTAMVVTKNNLAPGIPTAAMVVTKNNVASDIPTAAMVVTKKQRTDAFADIPQATATTYMPMATATTYMPMATTTTDMPMVTTTTDMPMATTTTTPPKATTKHIVMLVLPNGIPTVSSKEFFNAVSDITPLGCVMCSHFPLMVKKTCWRSLQVYPVDNWGKWKHVGMGKEPALHPHMLRISVAQASTVGE